MPWWGWLLTALAVVVVLLVLLVGLAVFLKSRSEGGGSTLARRVLALPLRRKLALARRLLGDRRVSLRAKALLPGLVVYLALPIDIIPDFVPVLGYLDDLVAIALVVVLLARAVPPQVMDEHLAVLEGGGPEGGPATGA